MAYFQSRKLFPLTCWLHYASRCRVVEVVPRKGGPPVNIQRRRFLYLAGGLATLPVAARTARAQAYPARSARILVATTAGGATDLAARLIAQWLTEKLGQSFFVENRPGGNNNIGTEAAARSPADGYTLFMANSVNTINASLYAKLSYNFIADFAPIVRVVRSPLLLMVHPSVPARTVLSSSLMRKPIPTRSAWGPAVTAPADIWPANCSRWMPG